MCMGGTPNLEGVYVSFLRDREREIPYFKLCLVLYKVINTFINSFSHGSHRSPRYVEPIFKMTGPI